MGSEQKNSGKNIAAFQRVEAKSLNGFSIDYWCFLAQGKKLTKIDYLKF